MHLDKIAQLIETIRENLNDDPRKLEPKGKESCLAGDCVIACEVLLHLLGDKSGWAPYSTDNHWFLRHKSSGAIIDPTLKQLSAPVQYDQAQPKKFLTQQPSTKAQIVLDRIANGGIALAKNIGFMTFPKLGEGSVHTKPMTVSPEKFPTYRAMGNSATPRTDTGDRGAMQFRVNETRPAPSSKRVLSGWATSPSGAPGFDPATYPRTFDKPTGTKQQIMDTFVHNRPTIQKITQGKSLNSTEGHEAQHGVFIRLKQRYGEQTGRQIISRAHDALPVVERNHVSNLFDTARPNGGGYDPNDIDEEKITHLQNYLQDPVYRQRVHKEMGIDKKLHKQRASVQLARSAWRSLQMWAQKLEPHEVGIAKSEVDLGLGSDRISCVAVFNSSGMMLMGKRNDTGRWNCPGGHCNTGETPEAAARREVKEETGLKVRGLKFLGKGVGGRNSDKEIYCYKAISDDKPDGDNDPDQECSEWQWFDISNGIPQEIRYSLHNHDNDILLQHLGLQDGKIDGTMELSKSWKHMFTGAIAAASIASAPMAQVPDITNDAGVADAGVEQETPEVHAAKTWTPKGLHEDLHPIAQLESSNGKNVNHLKHPQGEFHTAVGALGLKPITAYDEYTNTPWLQKVFPDLQDKDKFVKELKTNNAFYNHIATTHWLHLKKMFGNDRAKTAYSWRYGMGAASKDAPELQAVDPYVQAYNNMFNAAQAKKVGNSLINPLAKAESLKPKQTKSKQKQLFDHYSTHTGLTELNPKFQGTGAVGPEKARTKRIPRTYLYHADTAPETHVAAGSKAKYRVELPSTAKLYDLGSDPHELMTPKVRKTKYGTFYEPVDFDTVEKKIKSMGYFGYHSYSPTVPNAVAVFSKVKAKQLK